MPGIVWTRHAVQDLKRLFDFVKEKNPDAARKAAQQISKAAATLIDNPHLGKPMADETGRRELATSFGKNGYILRYMLEDDHTVVVIRVWHYLELRNH